MALTKRACLQGVKERCGSCKTENFKRRDKNKISWGN